MSIPSAPTYSASKHAVLGFARSVALTVKKRNIRVNVVHPFFSGESLDVRSTNVGTGTLIRTQRLGSWTRLI
jgi:NAD(P)-dependent dehydrogenase (short-subunit alcohol dehydrogenase family)